MRTFACVLVKSPVGENFVVPCGSDNYVVLDGRLSNENALEAAIEHFTTRKPSTKYIAVYKASSISSKGKVVATFPNNCENVFEPAVNEGAY